MATTCTTCTTADSFTGDFKAQASSLTFLVCDGASEVKVPATTISSYIINNIYNDSSGNPPADGCYAVCYNNGVQSTQDVATQSELNTVNTTLEELVEKKTKINWNVNKIFNQSVVDNSSFTINVSPFISPDATSVILQTHMRDNEGDYELYLNTSPTPTPVSMVRSTAGSDDVGGATQGVYPIDSSGNLTFISNNIAGGNGSVNNICIWILGYYE